MHAPTPYVGRGGQGECSYLPQAPPLVGRGSLREQQYCRTSRRYRRCAREQAVASSPHSYAADAALHRSCQKPHLSRTQRDPASRHLCNLHADHSNRLPARCSATVAGPETSATAVGAQTVRSPEQPVADRSAIPGVNGTNGHNGRNGAAHMAGSGVSLAGADSGPVVVAPEDFTLEPGELSAIDRDSPCHPADVFRCTGCVEPACQV